jgi:prepilin-type N-terminal cleavage/methylation domain-containing protein
VQVSKNRGFTIIELVIVLTIIGLVTAIAAPNIDLGRYRLDTALQGIGSTIMLAQRAAVTRQHNIVVRFDVPNQAIFVHYDGDNDGALDTGERERRYPLGDQVIFGTAGAPAHGIGASVVTFTDPIRALPSVTFHRNGSASQAGGFYLAAARSAAGGKPTDARVMELERSTGRVSWYRYDGSQWKRGM